MPDFLRNAPIQRKLMLIILMSCATAVLAAGMVEAGCRFFTERNNFKRDIAMLARVIALNIRETVAGQDALGAKETLAGLGEIADIRAAGIWLPDGRVFCRFGEADTLERLESHTRFPHAGFEGLMLRHFEPLKMDGKVIGTLYLRADFGPGLLVAARYDLFILLVAMGISALAAFFVSQRLQTTISRPIRRLAETAARVALDKDYSLRAEKFSTDEVGAFTDVFNYMLGEVERQDGVLRRQIHERARVEQEIDKLHKDVLAASRQAGMAEVATGVLHNVGNVLNSVNISAALLTEQLDKSRAANVGRLAQILRSHGDDLAGFLTTDPKGRALPEYLAELGRRLDAERLKMHGELRGLSANIEHIKEIVAMQQSYAKVAGETESLSAPDLIEDAVRMNAAAFTRHGVTLERDLAPVPFVSVDKHKVLQILINLLRNAKYAVDETTGPSKLIRIRTSIAAGRKVAITVSDNGVGIAPENLTRVFAHGFTTRKEGHGFGLHSGALAAKEMGGELLAHSDGPGHGATFTLTVPIAYDLTALPTCPPTPPALIAAS